jgi:hypothetical protein
MAFARLNPRRASSLLPAVLRVGLTLSSLCLLLAALAALLALAEMSRWFFPNKNLMRRSGHAAVLP